MEAFVGALVEGTEVVERTYAVDLVAHNHADNPVAASALEAGAAFVVTGDRKHLPPQGSSSRPYRRVQIVARSNSCATICDRTRGGVAPERRGGGKGSEDSAATVSPTCCRRYFLLPHPPRPRGSISTRSSSRFRCASVVSFGAGARNGDDADARRLNAAPEELARHRRRHPIPRGTAPPADRAGG